VRYSGEYIFIATPDKDVKMVRIGQFQWMEVFGIRKGLLRKITKGL
jgi:hypothetical protein